MTPPNGKNRGFYANPELDRLVEEGRKTGDPVRRSGIYGRVQEILFDDLPYVPLWFEDNWVVVSKKVTGYRLRPDAGFQGLVNAYKSESL
jgi:peptide/nickel transport system substrate-binding protein